MKKWTRRRKRWVAVCIVAALAVLTLYSSFGFVSVCTVCGSIQQTTEWQIPFTEITYLRSHSESLTPLSQVVEKHHLCPDNSHTWLFASGSGNGVTCAIGPGRHLYTGVESPDVANFIDAVATYDGRGSAIHWLTRLLDPKRAMETSSFIRTFQIPKGGFASRQQFEQCKHDNQFVIAELWSE